MFVSILNGMFGHFQKVGGFGNHGAWLHTFSFESRVSIYDYLDARMTALTGAAYAIQTGSLWTIGPRFTTAAVIRRALPKSATYT
jgi:hypothetical protein